MSQAMPGTKYWACVSLQRGSESLNYFFLKKLCYNINMPFYRKKKSSTRPRKPAKKYRKKPAMMQRINRPVMPDTVMVKLRYHTNILLDPAAGLAANHFFRANGIYDPDYTGVGHQPMGMDQWAAFYQHFQVLGSRLTARFVSQSDAASTGTALAGVGLQRSATSVASVDSVVEARDANTRIMTSANAKQDITVTRNFSAKRFFGVKDVRDNDHLQGLCSGSDPAQVAYFNVFLAPLVSSADVASTTVSVLIEYIVLFKERNELPSS